MGIEPRFYRNFVKAAKRFGLLPHRPDQLLQLTPDALSRTRGRPRSPTHLHREAAESAADTVSVVPVTVCPASRNAAG